MPLYRRRAGRGGEPWAISALPSALYRSVARPERRRAPAAGAAQTSRTVAGQATTQVVRRPVALTVDQESRAGLGTNCPR